MIYSKKIFILMFVGVLMCSACVERGKPMKKEEAKIANSKDKKTIDHYTCPKGHKGSEKQGTCAECGSVLTHNQAFHGTSGVALPKPTLNDPFQTNKPAANPGPAQNSFGDYHYVCPTGHPGGSATGTKCTTCQAQLIHNQPYHR
jgi:hypothetical protein